MLTGVLYYNYTKDVTDIIDQQEDDEDFKLLMELCLKNDIITSDIVRHYLDTFRNNPDMCKLYRLYKVQRGRMLNFLKFQKYMNEIYDKPKTPFLFMKKWWYITIMVCIDTAIIAICVIMIDYNMMANVTMQSI